MKPILFAILGAVLATGSAHAFSMIETLGTAATQQKLNSRSTGSAKTAKGVVQRKLASCSKKQRFTDPDPSGGGARKAGASGARKAGGGGSWLSASSAKGGRGGGWATNDSKKVTRRR